MSLLKSLWTDKHKQVVMFSSTAIALYGYDQGMMSLINTNKDYLSTMGISEQNPLVGVIVSVYYLGCAVGAVLASWYSDSYGRKKSIFACLALASLGNLIMFISGLGYTKGAMATMLVGRVVMGLGVGGIDCVVPTFSSELTEDDSRGKALAQEFQANILGLNIAFAINLALTNTLGRADQWSWRIPIIFMQLFSLVLMALIGRFPESPRFLLLHDREDDAANAMRKIYPDEDEFKQKHDTLVKSHEEEDTSTVTYTEMLTPGHDQFHPTIITIMGQVNQALTGYGAVSVYGPQIFELLGFGKQEAEYITMGNYVSYLILMTLAWMTIDALGRRRLMVSNSLGLTINFVLLTIFGGLASNREQLSIPMLAPAIPGIIALYIATGNFGIGWLATVWLIPTEIYPTSCRSKGTAISVIIWGLANFAVTLLTPVLFNNAKYWIFLVFAVTNAFAGWWTYTYLPESGGRSFEENQTFFQDAKDAGTWRVSKVAKGEYKRLPYPQTDDGEETPLLRRIGQQLET